MANLPITELDFAAIKTQLKNYLKGQDRFKDYDFEGSNMAVLLDILAYNTYQNNFYTNMAFSEMFLDSARNRNSVISHAKELNYLPRSAKSSKATINMSVTSNTLSNSILLPVGSRFSTSYTGVNYIFSTREAYLLKRVGTSSRFDGKCIDIFEGSSVTERFFVEDEIDGATISNASVDIDSLVVSVQIDPTESKIFTYTKDIFGIEENDFVYYLQPAFDDRYAITFGRGDYGYQPSKTQEITASYAISSGAGPNGAKIFRSLDYPTSSIVLVTAATGGTESESAENIKFFAPKALQIQERAVTVRDYEILLKQRFSEIQAISAYGGDELDPPRFGKVGISVKIFGDNTLSDVTKQQYLSYLSDKTPLSIKPIFVDPEFLYASIDAKVFYSRKLTNKSEEELEEIVKNAIFDFDTSELNGFGVKLKLSKLSKVVDDSDPGILNSEITVTPLIRYSPIKLISQTPSFKFGAQLIKPYPFQLSTGFTNYNPAISSSIFTYKNTLARIQDDGLGNIQVISADNTNVQILDALAGNVDYTTGTVNLIEFIVDDYAGSSIEIFANTISKDINSPKNRLLSISKTNLNITLIETA